MAYFLHLSVFFEGTFIEFYFFDLFVFLFCLFGFRYFLFFFFVSDVFVLCFAAGARIFKSWNLECLGTLLEPCRFVFSCSFPVVDNP